MPEEHLDKWEKVRQEHVRDLKAQTEANETDFRFVGERGAANRDAADGGERMRNDKETDKEKATAGERGGAISGNPSSGSLKY